MKKNKCKKCKKQIHRDEVHEYNVGYFHPHCYETYKKVKLRAEADKAWQMATEEMYGDECEMRGTGEEAETCSGIAYCSHHFFYKGNFEQTRYTRENAVRVCSACHTKWHYNDPKLMNKAIEDKRGKEWYDNLLIEARKPTPQTSIAYYERKIEELT